MPEPDRRKRHLGLYIGGAAAAVVTVKAAVREMVTHHRMQFAGALAGAAATAATVTMVTVQPWTHDSGYEAPRAEPRSSAPPTHGPPGPGPSRPPGTRHPSSIAPPTEGPPGTSGSAPPSAVLPQRAGTAPPLLAAPIGPAEDGDSEPGGGGDTADDVSDEDADAPPTQSPGPTPAPSKPATDPPANPPPAGEPSRSGLCLDLSLPPLLEADTCLLG
ncbi:hypothetical protein ABZX56_10905 [Streptomyces parvulus]|uniref:hypothetical protein n=1 Tax=Streptomyces parvulus TaxID=146923 RepID=UPI0033A6D3E8